MIDALKHLAVRVRADYMNDEITLNELDIIINRLQFHIAKYEGF